METDQNSWCKPDKAPPPGVEGGLPATKPPQPHKVFKWNEPRDRELRELEQMARDGLRVSNSFRSSDQWAPGQEQGYATRGGEAVPLYP